MIRNALDSNILIYNHLLGDEGKRSVAHELLTRRPVVSTQAISEYLNVMKRLLPVPKAEILRLCAEWMRECIIKPVGRDTITLAERLVTRHDFQIFDAIIVASALEADCEILYSEDMHHGLIVENRLRILNPFIQ
jgi:predicted nucleic acid-binding protein